MSTIIVFLNICAILSLITQWVLRATDELEKTYTGISVIFRILVFIINAFIIKYYYNMAQFFIVIIQDDSKKAKKFMRVMWLVIGVIIFTIGQENIYLPTYTILFVFEHV